MIKDRTEKLHHFHLQADKKKSQNKHDSAKHNGGALGSTQAVAVDWLGSDYITCVAHGRVTAGHATLGNFESRIFLTTGFSFKFGAEVL